MEKRKNKLTTVDKSERVRRLRATKNIFKIIAVASRKSFYLTIWGDADGRLSHTHQEQLKSSCK